MRRVLRIALVLLVGACLGRLFVSSASASESSALDHVASTLDKLLDAVRGASPTRVECVCRCGS